MNVSVETSAPQAQGVSEAVHAALFGVVAAVLAAAVIAAIGAPDPVLVAGKIALAALFLVAACAKLFDRTTFVQVITGFGVPSPLARPLATAVIFGEFCVAVALLVPETAVAGAGGALAMLLGFSTAGVLALARGRADDCGCLGPLRRMRFGRMTLVRNGVLAALAGAVAIAGGGDAGSSSLSAVGAVAISGAVLLLASVVWARAERRPQEVAAATGVGDLRIVSGDGAGENDASLTRRHALGLGGAGVAATLLGLPELPDAHARRTISCFCCQDCTCCCSRDPAFCGHMSCCGGIAGGGVVETATGRAHMAVFGTVVDIGRDGPVAIGAFTWADAGWQGAGLRLSVRRINSYRRIPRTRTRELRGNVLANGEGSFPFVLRLFDGAERGAEPDTVRLSVDGLAAGGAGSGTGKYVASGRLVEGDITVTVMRERRRRRRRS